MIVGVINGSRILITKYKSGFRHNALVADFMEIGETVEETVRREVMEETGLRVKNIQYYESQPWGIASDILMGFYCDVDGSTEIHRDDRELGYAEWVERKDIILQPTDHSLTNEMMRKFRYGYPEKILETGDGSGSRFRIGEIEMADRVRKRGKDDEVSGKAF